VTGDAMEIRGGCGYIEDFVEARLVRDAHLGSIWEGTSNIVAVDAIERAVGRERADAVLEQSLRRELTGAAGLPDHFRATLDQLTSRALAFARDIAARKDHRAMRRAASALYNATSAVLLAAEGAGIGEAHGDWSRVALAALVMRHKLTLSDPLADAGGGEDETFAEALIEGCPIDRDTACRVVPA
jgi:hypothetical protein